MPRQNDTLTIEDVRLIFRNFSGEEGPYNPSGKRTFAAVIPNEKLAQQMIADGWNVKYTKMRDEDDIVEAYIPVEVSYKARPPLITLITDNSRAELTEDMLNVLDWSDIETADIIITPYHYDFNGETGIKAYLRTMFVVINQDELQRKYASQANDD